MNTLSSLTKQSAFVAGLDKAVASRHNVNGATKLVLQQLDTVAKLEPHTRLCFAADGQLQPDLRWNATRKVIGGAGDSELCLRSLHVFYNTLLTRDRLDLEKADELSAAFTSAKAGFQKLESLYQGISEGWWYYVSGSKEGQLEALKTLMDDCDRAPVLLRMARSIPGVSTIPGLENMTLEQLLKTETEYVDFGQRWDSNARMEVVDKRQFPEATVPKDSVECLAVLKADAARMSWDIGGVPYLAAVGSSGEVAAAGVLSTIEGQLPAHVQDKELIAREIAYLACQEHAITASQPARVLMNPLGLYQVAQPMMHDVRLDRRAKISVDADAETVTIVSSDTNAYGPRAGYPSPLKSTRNVDFVATLTYDLKTRATSTQYKYVVDPA